jgi:sulfide:quinone oxidoreductase
MDIRTVDTGLSVGPQITSAEVAELARRGFKTIICNRPDGEAPEQPGFAAIEAAARAAGMSAHHIPVVPGGIAAGDVKRFALALAEFPAPVFAYCRTGTRSTALWALSAAGSGQSVDAVLAHAAKAGYDLSGMRPMLDASASAEA